MHQFKEPMHHNETLMQREYIDPELTREKAESQNWHCIYCGCEMLDPAGIPASSSPAMERLARKLGIEPFSSRWIGKVNYHRATAEHLVPVVEGGSNDPDNIVAACQFCNSRRGDLPEAEARAEIDELIRTGKHPCVKGA